MPVRAWKARPRGPQYEGSPLLRRDPSEENSSAGVVILGLHSCFLNKAAVLRARGLATRWPTLARIAWGG